MRRWRAAAWWCSIVFPADAPRCACRAAPPIAPRISRRSPRELRSSAARHAHELFAAEPLPRGRLRAARNRDQSTARGRRRAATGRPLRLERAAPAPGAAGAAAPSWSRRRCPPRPRPTSSPWRAGPPRAYRAALGRAVRLRPLRPQLRLGDLHHRSMPRWPARTRRARRAPLRALASNWAAWSRPTAP